MVIILICAGVPLLKKVIKVLMMTSSVDKVSISDDLLNIDGVDGVHDLHIWQFVPGKDIAHCHVVSKLSETKMISV